MSGVEDEQFDKEFPRLGTAAFNAFAPEERCGDPTCEVCWLLARPGESREALIVRLTLRFRGVFPWAQGQRPERTVTVVPRPEPMVVEVVAPVIVAPAPAAKVDPVLVQCRRCRAWRAPNTPCAPCATRMRNLRNARLAALLAEVREG